MCFWECTNDFSGMYVAASDKDFKCNEKDVSITPLFCTNAIRLRGAFQKEHSEENNEDQPLGVRNQF